VIAVRVGDEDRGDALGGECAEQRRDVGWDRRARVDHRDLALADDIGLRPVKVKCDGLGARTRRTRGPTAMLRCSMPALWHRGALLK
jgi:hypothetical protein